MNLVVDDCLEMGPGGQQNTIGMVVSTLPIVSYWRKITFIITAEKKKVCPPCNQNDKIVYVNIMCI